MNLVVDELVHWNVRRYLTAAEGEGNVQRLKTGREINSSRLDQLGGEVVQKSVRILSVIPKGVEIIERETCPRLNLKFSDWND